MFQAVKSTLEDIALRIAFHASPNAFEFAPFCDSVQLVIIAKKISWMAFYIPNALHGYRVNMPFNHFTKFSLIFIQARYLFVPKPTYTDWLQKIAELKMTDSLNSSCL